MYISSLTIKNYKSIKDKTIFFNKNINLIIGINGSGKSAIVESLMLSNPFMLFHNNFSTGKKDYLPEYNVRDYITENSLTNFNKEKYFEFTIEIKNIKNKYFNSKYLKYTIRYYPFEQYFLNCFLINLETDNISITVTFPKFENSYISTEDIANIKVQRIINNQITNINYNQYMGDFYFNSFEELVFLKDYLPYIFEHSFISPYINKINGIAIYSGSGKDNIFLDEIYEYNRTSDQKLRKKQLDEFKLFSREILLDYDYWYVFETLDRKKERHEKHNVENNNIKENNINSLDIIFKSNQTGRGGIYYKCLSDGIKRILTLFWYIKKYDISLGNNEKDGTPFLILDEIELNIHPKFVNRIYELIKKQDRQFIICTHSSILINNIIKDGFNLINTSLNDHFLTDINKINNLKEINEVISDLGYKASDIFQTNCIIWVEGPSDRIYLNKWISLVDSNLIEGYHYSIMFYGGRLLNHLTIDNNIEIDNYINLLKINKNGYLIMDSDKKDKNSDINRTKKRIQKELYENIWITEGREIENYLPIKKIIRKYNIKFDDNYDEFIKIDNIFKKKVKYSKNKVKYSREIIKFITKEDISKKLKIELSKLIKFINSSN